MYLSGSEDSNADIIRRLYQSLEMGDFAAYLNLLAVDIVYHAAGRCFFAGDYHGKEKLSKLAQTIYAETQGTHRAMPCGPDLPVKPRFAGPGAINDHSLHK